jgi:hypothetical protein
MDFLFAAIDINVGGVMDAPELVTEEVGVEEQQQVEQQQRPLPPLSRSIPFLDGKLEGAPVYYATIPTEINWKDGKHIQTCRDELVAWIDEG